MRNLFLLGLLFFMLNITASRAQEMDPKKLRGLIESVTDTFEINGNSFRFVYKDAFLFTIYDENANRMRIISPIVQRSEIEEEQLLNALVANFHSALDVKYALSDEIIWSVFTHPLRELSDHQVLDAIDQVYLANVTFGTTYSSTNLVFPGNSNKKDEPGPKKLIKRD
ncbi:hypothetical protein [Ulvibacterium sp.]|uniref:hypothetical protein n=1 Tax=Ulvibacterium sp. TaxID=2665914 RepID=UPI002629F6D9|nr:hypothetical protein [Ulvibacterium sp.]